MDRMHIRDNLKIATVSGRTHHICTSFAESTKSSIRKYLTSVIVVSYLFPTGPVKSKQGARVAADSRQSSQRGGEVCQGEG